MWGTAMEMTNAGPEISVVVPIYNEESNLRELHSRVVGALEPLGRTFEVVAVDDGSTDRSLETLRAIRAEDDRLRIVALARNFGQNPATFAGFERVRGQIVVTLDADLQNPPEEMPKLIEKLEEGYDVVSGWREKRHDTLFRRAASVLLNFFVSRIIRVRLRDYGCALKAYRREVVGRLALFTHRSRYLPVEVAWLGVRIAEVKVEHQERTGGRGKYGLLDLLRVNFDLFTGITSAPIQFIGLVGGLFALVGFGMGGFVAFRRVVLGFYHPLSSIAALFFILSGVQMVATGLMCEYISRIYLEVQNKPYYIVKEVIE